MKKIIINVSEFSEEIDFLERISYEIEGRKSVLELMIFEGNYNENDDFKNFWEEYLQYLKFYEELKYKFYINHLSNYTEGTWELNFFERKVTITIEDEE